MDQPTQTQPPKDPTRKKRVRLASRASVVRLAALFLLISIVLTLAWVRLINMPGSAHTGPLPELSSAQAETSIALRRDVEQLAGAFADRNRFNPRVYELAGQMIFDRLLASGLEPRFEQVTRGRAYESRNIVAEIQGTTHPAEIIVVGAHYDTHPDTPGADDNASGVAGVLALAHRLASSTPDRTIRLVLFADEEPPQFMTDDMGSVFHATTSSQQSERIIAMLSLEMIGFFDDTPGSQHYPRPLDLCYPDTGDFIAVVGNLGSTGLVRRIVADWRDTTPFPCYGAALPSGISGVGWSDHWSFWQAGYPAVMLTDTSFFRNPNYHKPTDTPNTLDYERMARVIDGIEAVVRRLATSLQSP